MSFNLFLFIYLCIQLSREFGGPSWAKIGQIVQVVMLVIWGLSYFWHGGPLLR